MTDAWTIARGHVAETRWFRARLALLVFAGYYVGARIGLAFTFDPNPISVLWPPNSILFAALLVTRTNMWWVVLVGAFPAHLLSEIQGGVPLAMVLCWYASNIAEAMIGAGLARAICGQAKLFSTTRYTVAFIVSAIFAPFVSSFLDSAFVTSIGWGDAPYWELWRTRFFANVVAALTIVPLIVTWTQDGVGMLRTMQRRRSVEALVLLFGLSAVSIVVFDSHFGTDGPLVLLYLPLPFLLWGAVRFGSIGASTSFAIVAFVVIWGAGHGMGPLATGLSVDNAFSVQLFLIFAGPLLLCLAALSEERERAQRKLRSSEQRFAKAFRSSPSAISIMRQTDGRIIEVNDQWVALFGYSREEAVGRTADQLDLHVRHDAYEEIRRLVAERGRVANLEIEVRTRQREVRQALVSFETADMDGEACFIANITDVTERRRTEDLNQRLAHASRLTAMGELTASVAHEINQPMSAILSNVDAAEMLLDRGEVDRDELRRILDDIRNDDLRASDVVRHVRGLANKREIDLQPFDLNELVRSVLRLVAPIAQRRRVSLGASYGDLPLLNGDRIHIQQVLLNLLFNGIDAMSDVAENARQIEVSTSRDGVGRAEVAVRDCGHGIASAHIDKIFDSFFTTKKEGMGLGLSIARSLVLAHGGTIGAENNVGAGATFRFTLPTASAHERVDAAATTYGDHRPGA